MNRFEFCWQPIETAPKDDKEVLLYCPKNGAYVGCWMNAERSGDDQKEEYLNFYDYEDPRFEPKLLGYHGCGRCCNDPSVPEPTHWMPIPEKFKETLNGSDSSEEKES